MPRVVLALLAATSAVFLFPASAQSQECRSSTVAELARGELPEGEELCAPILQNGVRMKLYRRILRDERPGSPPRIDLDARVRLLVDADGGVARVEVREVTGDEWYDAYLASLARRMRFAPATRDGVPVASWHERTLTFSPPARAGPNATGPKLLNPDEVNDYLRDQYPSAMRRRGVGARVLTHVHVNVMGEVTDAVVLNYDRDSDGQDFVEAAIDAAYQMKFRPAMRDVGPVARWHIQPFTFQVRFY